jgi:hypothetical protein
VRFSRADGSADTVAVELRTRGIFRRRPSVCTFPPLRLTIRPRAARETQLAGERRVKLVTHCRPSDQYEQYVLQEYLIYRAYALLTDLSLRTRLARVTYEDAASKEKPVTRYAILIEDQRRLAERVQERLYAGYCGPPEDFEQIFARFRQQRPAIEALYDLGPLNPDHRERARRYYADFFRLIDDPRRVRREMLARCR